MKKILAALILFSQCFGQEVPSGLPPVPWPKDNPYSAEKEQLGKYLYFDKRLSSDGTVSCATCHTLQDAFSDHLPVSTGIAGNKGSRNAPSVINTGYLKHLFWDGRSSSLEEQAIGPLANPQEMTTFTEPHVAHKKCEELIAAIPGYKALFHLAFGDPSCKLEHIAQAIATFERSVLSGNSPYDRYIAGDKSAMTQEQIQGMLVFKKAQCINCHNGVLFTDERFLNIGIGMNDPHPDLGRYNITHEDKDWGAFKVPTLREVENTFPYMHDGKMQTLEEVIHYYDKGGNPCRNLHPSMKPLHLSEADKKALISFLKALSGQGWQHFKEPSSFP
jgi:cytochrome c peroxidase